MRRTEAFSSQRFDEPARPRAARWPRSAAAIAAVLALWLPLAAPAARADEVSVENPFWGRLAGPMTSVVEGQRWRDSLHQVAERADVDLWVDRRVDPTRPVDSGRIGPTVFAALRQLASQRQCEVMPVAGVVLVGRREWLDRTSAALWRIEQAAPAGQPVEVSWPELTTPSEAIAIASGRSATADRDASLPHDLWPAVQWRSIDRRTAVALVLAQFDQQLRAADSLDSLATVPAESGGAFPRRYAAGRADAAIRREVRRADPSGRVREIGSWLEVVAEPAAHRAATAAWLSEPAGSQQPGGTGAPRRFDLRLKNKPAGAVLGQLAATAGKSYRVQPEARAACERLVSLQSQNATLAELAQQVAQQIGVQVDWGEESVVVRPER